MSTAVAFGCEALEKFLFCTFSSTLQFFLQWICVFIIGKKKLHFKGSNSKPKWLSSWNVPFYGAGNKSESSDEKGNMLHFHSPADKTAASQEYGVSTFLIFLWHFTTAENGEFTQTFYVQPQEGGVTEITLNNPESRHTGSFLPKPQPLRACWSTFLSPYYAPSTECPITSHLILLITLRCRCCLVPLYRLGNRI